MPMFLVNFMMSILHAQHVDYSLKTNQARSSTDSLGPDCTHSANQDLRKGCASHRIGDGERELKAGSIVVIPADTPDRFVNSGDMTLRQIDVHASGKFVQTNL